MKLAKICGLTEVTEAAYVNEAHADFAGMVLFFPKSKRNIDIEKAKRIMAALDPSVKSVAVTVKPERSQLEKIQEAGFDYVQIHGSLDDSLLRDLDIQVIKAFNVSDLSEFSHYLNNPHIAGFVLDSSVPGSGKVFDYSVLEKLPETDRFTLIAGGLNPANVSDVLRRVRVSGADTSSGVENDNGQGKNPRKIREFVEKVHESV